MFYFNHTLMKNEFDYLLLPRDFAHCLNDRCSRAGECLRRQAALHVPSERPAFTVVNPACIVADGEDCTYFKADTRHCFASGITHLLDNVPHNDAVAIKQQLINYFGRTHFYRLWRKERLFSPAQQEYVRNLFLQRGIEEPPVFDEYVERYEE